MLNNIQILPNIIAQQIAAGEVVHRPASIVKELLENSIDAGAKSIHLILEDAGKSLIKVIDDGKGMNIPDAKISFLRHATSKIKSIDDLLKIKTMGFRGEALASIAAVCQVEIQTRCKEDEIGISILIEGNRVKGESFVQTARGTSVTVKNIFYNIPSRRIFLKSNRIEFKKIIDEYNRLIIAHPKIRFILHQKINNKLQKYLDFPPNSLSDRIIKVIGKKIDEKMIYLDEINSGVHLKGYMVNPSIFKKTIKEQFIFVNNRFIKNPYLSKLILKSFKEFFPYVIHPSYFLFFFLDTLSIDINLHPSKKEIRFKNESFIHTFLSTSLQRTLKNVTIKKSILSHNIKLYANYNPFYNEKMDLSIKNLYKYVQKSIPNIGLYNNITFQVYKKYIISTLNTKLIIIDQHLAHKRICYDFFLKNKIISSQQLLSPIILSYSRIQLNLLKFNNKYLITMGFSILFLEDKLIVKATPVGMNKNQINIFLLNLSEIKINDNYNKKLANAIANAIAIKHGLFLSIKEMNHIIHELFYTCTNPNFTPSGKKIFITLNSTFIEERFQ